jgi:predicted permease
MDAFVRDVRHAVRVLLRRPAFTAVAALSLALGIGANTAIFSLANALLIRDLPQERPQDLVDLYVSVPDFEWGTFSHPDFVALEDGTQDIFQAVGGMRLALAALDAGGSVQMLPTELVTGEWFEVQGIGAEVGRVIQPQDDVAPGGHFVVMLGYDYWRRAFGGDPDAVGRELRIAGRPYTIIGVADRRYTGHIRGLDPDLMVPMMMVNEVTRFGHDELEARGSEATFGRARLAPGASPAEAELAMERVAQQLRREHPDHWFPSKAFRLLPTRDVVVHPAMDGVIVPAFGMMFAVVGLVLLIACANLASFLLARATDRRKEIAVRVAMGAGRGALLRQLLTETILLALAGGGLGLILSTWGTRSLLAMDLPFPLPLSLDVEPDGMVLAFTAAVSVLAGILFGLAPALRATNVNVAPTLKHVTTGEPRRRVTLRNALVTGQVAMCLTLLVGAALLLRSLVARQSVDPGFGGVSAAVVSLQLPEMRYPEGEAIRLFWQEARTRLQALPEVEAVGRTTHIHLNTLSFSQVEVSVPGVDPPPDQPAHILEQARVDGDFFRAVDIPLLAGRLFNETDRPGGEAVAVVNRAFVERFWPRSGPDDALGRTAVTDGEEVTIVGVVETAKIRSLGEPPTPFVYQAMSQRPTPAATLIVRTRGTGERALADALAGLRAIDPQLMIWETTTMERHLAITVLPHRLAAFAAGLFAALALTLACVGLYGVVSYAVATRRREVGIRMSLGADGGKVVAMLMADGMRLVAVGVGAGFLASLVFAHVLRRFLFGVSTLDPTTFIAVPAILLVVAALAAWVPARRAARVPPAEALRAE